MMNMNNKIMKSFQNRIQGVDCILTSINDFKTFPEVCWQISNELHIKILRIDKYPTEIVKFFYSANFKSSHKLSYKRNFQILFNIFHRFIAFAELHINNNLIFIDIPELDKYFNGSFTVLKTDDLNEIIDIPYKKRFDYFNEYELKDINYQKPQRAGDLVFNYWD